MKKFLMKIGRQVRAKFHESWLFFALSAWVALTVLLAIFGLRVFPGYQLWRSFHLAAFYVAANIFFIGLYLYKPDLSLHLIVRSCLGWLPFLTFSISLKIFFSQPSALTSLINAYLSPFVSVPMFLLLTVALLLLVFNNRLINLGVALGKKLVGRLLSDNTPLPLRENWSAEQHREKYPFASELATEGEVSVQTPPWLSETGDEADGPHTGAPELSPSSATVAATPPVATQTGRNAPPACEWQAERQRVDVGGDASQAWQQFVSEEPASAGVSPEEVAEETHLEEGLTDHQQRSDLNQWQANDPGLSMMDEVGHEKEDEASFPWQAAGEVDEPSLEPTDYQSPPPASAVQNALPATKSGPHNGVIQPTIVQEQLISYPKSKRRWLEYGLKLAQILPPIHQQSAAGENDEQTQANAVTLIETLREFKIEAKITGVIRGPAITQYELFPAPGIKLSRIEGLADNIALRLAAHNVRIVAPIPGKGAVGIELPNPHRRVVSFRQVMTDERTTKAAANMALPVALGQRIDGQVQVLDLSQAPHLLIAGATGSGKSVCVNVLISSLISSRSPMQMRLLLIDPKIVELKLYNGVPHLLTPVITEPDKALQALRWCLTEMEHRYALLDHVGVRDIIGYNLRLRDKGLQLPFMEYLVVIVDEFADLMALTGKEMESLVARMAAMARAVGIHLVLATQRPSVDVITGLIKANLPTRIAFMVASKTDSRIILDTQGAERLLGRGDMLFAAATSPHPQRLQGTFLSEDEVETIAGCCRSRGEPHYIDDVIFAATGNEDLADRDGDPLYPKALQVALGEGQVSASLLQRRLQVGYNRAARLIEQMENEGKIGPQNGSKPRAVHQQ